MFNDGINDRNGAMRGNLNNGFIKWFAGFVLVAGIVGCDRSSVAVEQTGDRFAASEHTIASNKALAQELELANQQDFDDAQRGMIAQAPVGVVATDS